MNSRNYIWHIQRSILAAIVVVVSCSLIIDSSCKRGGYVPLLHPRDSYNYNRLAIEFPQFTRWVDPASLELSHDTGYVTTNNKVNGDYCDVGVYVEGASRLRAFFCEIGYEADNWHPIEAAPTYVLGPQNELLHLEIFSTPGKVVIAQALIKPASQNGFSGNGTLAMLRFHRGSAKPIRSISSPGPNDPPVSPLVFVRYASTDSPTMEITCTQDIFRIPGDYNDDDKVSMADLVPLTRKYDITNAISLTEFTLLTKNYGRNIRGFFIGRTSSITKLPFETSHVNGSNAERWQFLFLDDLPKRDEPWRVTLTIPLFPGSRRTVVYVRALNLDGYGGAISREAVNMAKAK